MNNRYRDHDAQVALERWPGNPDVALRIYTSRLIGAEPALVLHGGGNTSVKTRATNLVGDDLEVLAIKGSGADLDALEPSGLPFVDLGGLRKLRGREGLDDPTMAKTLRSLLLDPGAPNPSVETLVHAFVPWKYVDHSHAEAVLALSNRPHGLDRLAEALGEDVPVLPYVMPGFKLAKAVGALVDAHPQATALVLRHHGLLTFGSSAEAAYNRHIEVVTRAEGALSRRSVGWTSGRIDHDLVRRRALDVVTHWRPLLGRSPRWIVHHRDSDEAILAAGDPALAEHARTGPLTPDHVLRTRQRPAVVPNWPGEALPIALAGALEAWRADTQAYFNANRGRSPGQVSRLDEVPRVLWVAGAGLFTAGRTLQDARISADLAEQTLRVKRSTAGEGPYEGLPDGDLYDMEYWSLEQAKLGKVQPAALDGRVALITGGAGAVGRGIARQLLGAGAHVALIDRDGPGLQRAVADLGAGRLLVVQTDLLTDGAMARAFDAVTAWAGGVDLVVANVGAPAHGTLDTLTLEEFRRVEAVNLELTYQTFHEAARRLPSCGGDIVLVGTKNVASPGAGFGAYSATKAAAHQLAKVAALELAPHGIRVNIVAPDAVFADGAVPSGLWTEIGPGRAAARGLSTEDLPEFYRQRNLLKAIVTADDVGRAVVFFSSGATPTTGAVLPIDGGLPETFSR